MVIVSNDRRTSKAFSERAWSAGEQTGSHKSCFPCKTVFWLPSERESLPLRLISFWSGSKIVSLEIKCQVLFSRKIRTISYFSLKIRFDISCKLSPWGTICMKCQILFSKKKNSKCPLLKFLPRMQSVRVKVASTFKVSIWSFLPFGRIKLIILLPYDRSVKGSLINDLITKSLSKKQNCLWSFCHWLKHIWIILNLQSSSKF